MLIDYLSLSLHPISQVDCTQTVSLHCGIVRLSYSWEKSITVLQSTCGRVGECRRWGCVCVGGRGREVGGCMLTVKHSTSCMSECSSVVVCAWMSLCVCVCLPAVS